MIRRLAEGAVTHRGWVVGLTLALATAALLWGRGLRLDALPDVTTNQVLVLTRAPGLTPEEVERTLSRPIEAALGGVPGLREQRSLSRYGISSVTVVFDDDVSPWLARQMVTERLLSLELPEGVSRPELGPLTGGLGEIFHLTLSSPRRTPAELLQLGSLRVAPLLKAVPGVVEVNTWGGAQRTLDVIADSNRLAARGLTLEQLKQALLDSTGALAAGSLSAGQGQVLVRAVARPTTPGALAAAVVVPRTGLRVGDLGEVVDGTSIRLGAATRDGRGETLYLMVQMLRDANALEVMGRLHDTMPAVRAALPDDVSIDLVYDRSTLVRGTLLTVGSNLLEGALLVFVVLLAFLGSWRAGVLVASVIPLSMAFATAAMRTFEVPGNLMSLGALDFGLLVDGAIVMVEGLFHSLQHQPLGSEEKTSETLRERIREVAGTHARPVFFSVLVVLLVYVPVLSLTGVDGKMFRPMALTVVCALAAALVLSLTWVPAVASFVLRPVDVPSRAPWLVRGLNRLYPRLLGPVMRAPRWALVGAGLILVVGGVAGLSRGLEFTPQLDEGDLVIQTTRRPDISLEQAIAAAAKLEQALHVPSLPEVRQVVSRIGSPAVATDIMGLEQADVFVTLAPRGEWRTGLSREQLVHEIQQTLERQVPGAEFSLTQPIQMRFNEILGGAVTDVEVSVYGDDLPTLRTLSETLARVIAQVPGAVDVRVLAPPSVPLLTIRPRPIDTAQLGFSAHEVLEAVQAVQVGVPVGETRDGPVRIPLRLKVRGSAESWALSGLALPVSSGGVVPLGRVADVVAEDAPSLVNRRQGQRRLQVGFNVRGADLGSVVRQAEARVANDLRLPAGYRLEWGGQFESLTRALERLSIVVPVVVVLILVLLMLTFARARPALIILGLVPFGVAGGLMALAVVGLPISISAAIGFIALSGIAVMNGVVWVSRALELAPAGLPPLETAQRTALDRVRPVLMTAVVAALGFAPMMMATGVGAEVQRPLATVVVGGLIFSTLPAVLLLPAWWPWLQPRRRARAEVLPSPP